jgi:(R,R)-butanediol dehydrogenase/meso-butanediol dehydrogenase/diacetyl reductase
MRAARYHGRQDVRLEEVPEPVAGPGEVKLRVLYNGLCGSDVHEYFDGPIASSTTPHPLTGCTLPCILGHELSGEVVGLGPGVEDVAIGATVAVEPIETCGVCPRCRSGSRHLCRLIAFHGYSRSGGGLSDYTVVRRDMVHVLPVGLSGRHGALVEPMAVSHRAVRRVGALPGDLVAVHGAGPIGLGAVLALRAAGLRSVVADPSATRRAAASLLQADHVLDPATDDVAAVVRDLTGGLGAAGAIDAAGAPAAVRAALRATRPDGTVVLVGHHVEPIALRSGSLIFSEVRVTGSHIYDRSDIDAVIGAMVAGGYPLEDWTSIIDLPDVVGEGLVPLRDQGANKVLVRLGAPP